MLRICLALIITISLFCPLDGFGEETLAGVQRYRENIQPLFEMYCYMCHGDGNNEGGLQLDAFDSGRELLDSHETWSKVLSNLRAEIMPPGQLLRPSQEEMHKIENWIKRDVFDIDYQHPDPGHVTIRRLNRIEYRNTIQDLMGVDYNTEEEFPPDDTGYGFDNIGDVLSLSPLLLEKYITAAEAIVDRAMPKTTKVLPEHSISGRRFRNADRSEDGDSMSFYEAERVAYTFKAEKPGEYKLVLDVEVDGSFDYDPGECEVLFTVNGEERLRKHYAWQADKEFTYEFTERWQAGEYELAFELTPLTSKEQKKNKLEFEINEVEILGPYEKEHWVHPENYKRFFHKEAPPQDIEARNQYAFEVLQRFAQRAYRRPVPDSHIERLVSLAHTVYSLPQKSFEEGIGKAVTAILASPRFIFRLEEPGIKPEGQRYPYVDQYALASRLSYFLWSTMPDDELFKLAESGELRRNLEAQVARMLKNESFEAFIENFVGQWLQARDIEHIPINARKVLGFSRREARKRDIDFDSSIRRAMRRESEMMFEYIIKNNRSVLELIDSEYTFLNEELAQHYGIEGVEGDDMRRVTLPPGSPRGGVLTQGTVLVVTSNPTRTSIVKRGLFVLDSLLGTPPPPAPPNIPELEEAEEILKNRDREPTLREVMELHRREPLCSSCHERFDPIGIALENFNAMGMWREEEHGRPINPSGTLITGEAFDNVHDLKAILKNQRRMDFYRSLTEKLLTYAIGRGLHYYDQHTIDTIVNKLDENEGRFSTLLMGVIRSAPFLKMREQPSLTQRPSTIRQSKEPNHDTPSS